MKICICDDDQNIHPSIVSLIHSNSAVQNEHEVTSFFSGEELLEYYAQGKSFDLLYLDVELNQTNGIDVAKKIREIDETAIIIFVSNYRQYVFDTFPVGAFHYLVKPIEPKEFADVYARSVQKYKDLHSEIPLKWMYERYKIPIHKILYLEGVQRHVVFHTTDGCFEGVGKVSDYAAELYANGFVQVHQSFLVNMDYIKALKKDRVVLQNGEIVYISVRKRTEALKAFDQFLTQRKW